MLKKLLFIIGIFTVMATAQTIWTGMIHTDWYNDLQTNFTITTAEQLAGLAKLVNNGNDFYGKTIKLGNDIILNDTTIWNDWGHEISPIFTWQAIGSNNDYDETECFPFNGTFDGNGCIVSGAYFKYNARYIQSCYKGLFGYIGENGYLKNLGAVAFYIEGGRYIGGLVGSNKGKVDNCYAIGTLFGTNDVGGLVGMNEITGEITNSYFSGKVDCLEEHYGFTYFFGGLAGFNFGKIATSFSNGTVNNAIYIAGLIGDKNNGSEMVNCYYEGAGGKNAEQMKQQSTFINWDFENIWGINREINNGYPYLRIFGNSDLPNSINKIASNKLSSASFVGINNGQVNLRLKPGNYIAELCNLQGRVIGKVEIAAVDGINATNLKINNLSKGIFVLNVKQNDISIFSNKIFIK